MSAIRITPGSTSVVLPPFGLVKSDGTAVTSFAATNVSALTYTRPGGSPVSVTASNLSSGSAAYTSGGIYLVADGSLRVDWPDAAWAAGATGVALALKGTAGETFAELVVNVGLDATVASRSSPAVAQTITPADTAAATTAQTSLAGIVAGTAGVNATKLGGQLLTVPGSGGITFGGSVSTFATGGNVSVNGYAAGQSPAALVTAASIGKIAATLNATDVTGLLPAIIEGIDGSDSQTLQGLVALGDDYSDNGGVNVSSINGAAPNTYFHGLSLDVNVATIGTQTPAAWFASALPPVSLPAGAINAAAVAAGALNGKGNWYTGTPPTVQQIAAAILANPAFPLQTDVAGKVGVNNLPVEFLTSAEQTQLTTAVNDLVALLGRTDTAPSVASLQTQVANLLSRLPQAVLFDLAGNVKSTPQTAVTLTNAYDRAKTAATPSEVSPTLNIAAPVVNPTTLDTAALSAIRSGLATDASVQSLVAGIGAVVGRLPSNNQLIAGANDAQGKPPGAGADPLTCTFVISGTPDQPVADAGAWLTRDVAGLQVVDSGQTDTDGNVTFLVSGFVSAGVKRTFYFFAQKDGVESKSAVPVVCD